MSNYSLLCPDIGIDSAAIIDVHVAIGDMVQEGDAIITLESDKASMDVPADKSGVVQSITIQDGQNVSQGDVLVILELIDDTSAPTAATPSITPSQTESIPTSDLAAADIQSTAQLEVQSAPSESAEHVMLCPDIGIDSAAIIDVHVAIGDMVQEGDAIITLESDKASMDVPADKSGVVTDVTVQIGSNISRGEAILTVKTTTRSVTSVAPAAESTAPAQTATAPATKTIAPIIKAALTVPVSNAPTEADTLIYAGPATRRLARKLGVHLAAIAPTGPRGRVTMDDVFSHACQAIAAPTQVGGTAIVTTAGQHSLDDFSGYGEVTAESLSRLQALTAEHMHNINLTVPQVTQHDSVDISDLEAFRKSLKREAEQRDTKLTILPFVMKVCALGLKRMPMFNTSVDLASKQLFHKRYYNIGFAADTPNGLLVPVVHNVLDKSIWELSEEIIALATAAKKGTIKPPQMQGGCFTISSLGSIGGTHFTPIVNMPEVAILGIGQAQQQPICVADGSITTGMILPLSLSYDHRVINGADGARMVRFIADALQDLRKLVLL